MSIFQVIEWGMSLAEVELAAVVCDRLFERKGKWSFPALEATAMVMTFLVCCNKEVGALFSNTAWWIVILGLGISMSLGYREGLTEILAAMLLLYGVIFAFDFFIIMLVGLLSGNQNVGIEILHHYSGQRLLFFGIMRGVDVAVLAAAFRKKEKIQQRLTEDRRLLFFFGCLWWYFTIQMQAVQVKLIDREFLWTHIGSLGAFIGIILFYVLWKRYQTSQKDREEGRLRQQAILYAYEEAKKESIAGRKRLHDEKNHLLMLKGLLEEGKISEAGEYLDQLSDSAGGRKTQSWTGDDAIDLILNWKAGEAEKKGIRLEVDGDAFACCISEKDICCIFGNLLDNAIEACEKLPQEQRKITVKIRSQGEMMAVWIRNSISELPKERNGKMLSAKRGWKEGGYGLECVKDAVRRYKGDIKIHYDSEYFTVQVWLGMQAL